MVLLKLVLLLFASVSFSQPRSITKIGARPAECQSQSDTTVLTIADEFKAQSHQQFSTDQLEFAVAAGDPCYRVGTEISLEHASGKVKYLGKAFVLKVEEMNAGELLAHNNLKTIHRSSVEKYISKNQNKKMYIVYFKVMEKVADTILEDKYARLQTCFVSNADWRSYSLDDEKWKEELEEFKTGSKKADIWNGTNNCFKIGVSVDLTAKGAKEKIGQLIPTKLYLIHYTKITEEQASILGEKLSDLKERLSQKKDKYGGYTTMAVYDYQKPKAPEPQP